MGVVTIVHGTNDTVIPYELGHELFDHLTASNKTFIPLTDGGHNDVYAYMETFEALTKLLATQTP
jgi:fermentation-respiration switch protein FrsA (DUF1100 family)